MPQTSAAFQYQRVAEPNPGVFIYDPKPLAWIPHFSDRVPPLVSVGVSAQPTYTQPLVPIDTSHPELLRWVAKFPAHVDPKVSLQTSAQVFNVENIDPLPNAPPPTDLTWDSNYPAFLPPLGQLRRMSTALRASGGVLGRLPFADLRWLASYPAWVPRRLLHAARIPAPASQNLGALLAVPMFASWRPVMPAWLRRVALQPALGWYTHPTSSRTLIGLLTCIEWEQETWIGPTMLEETLRSGLMVDEVWTPPEELDEDIC